ncbi:MAG: type II toxin-antitoxin system mRNA interferase toxin, RelE/StbE family [Candidatus Omnitrophica bacterium]|nr:type II toxin-antitoxin system mRNA interferase toxin, RelE/StbE family [Candidatus Omnitrophota bacterium]
MTEARYKLELSPAAMRDLKKIPKHVQKEIVLAHLQEILEDPFGKSKPLVGALKGERSYSFGHKPEYRIIYFVEKGLITVTLIGSRENLYQRAKRRK